MSTYTLGNLKPTSAVWGLDRKAIQSVSALNGYTQMVDLLSWRWMVDLKFPYRSREDAGALEALVNRLVGGAHRLSLHRMDRPVPLGTMRGTPTLATTAAQFADSLTIGGAWDTSRRNLFPNSENLAAWTNFALGCTLGTQNTVVAPDGATTAESFTEDTSNGNHGLDRYNAYLATGVHTLSAHIHVGSGDRYAYLAMIAGGGVDHRAWFDLQAGTFSIQRFDSSTRAALKSVGGGWFRVSITANITNTSAPIQRVGMVKPGTSNTFGDYVGNGTSTLPAWGVQLEPGELTDYIPTTTAGRYASGTLLGGDMIGTPGQLFQVAEDCTANAAGQIVVPLVNRSRKSIASGTAVTWDRPSAEFVVMDTASAFGINSGGYMDPSMLRLMEVPSL